MDKIIPKERQAYFLAVTAKELEIIKAALEDFWTTCSGDKDIPKIIKQIDGILIRHERRQCLTMKSYLDCHNEARKVGIACSRTDDQMIQMANGIYLAECIKDSIKSIEDRLVEWVTNNGGR